MIDIPLTQRMMDSPDPAESVHWLLDAGTL